MALVYDPDFNIMQQSHGLFAIAKLLVDFVFALLLKIHLRFRGSFFALS